MKLTNKEIQVLINALEQHQGNLDSEWSCDLNQDEYNILNRLKQQLSLCGVSEQARRKRGETKV